MKEEIAAFELKFLVEEFQQLIGARIDNIYHVLPKEIILQLHLVNIGKKILRIMPHLVYLASQKPEIPEKPSNFCAYLRKYIGGAKIREIRQRSFERIIEIVLEIKEKKYILIAELFDKCNVILCDENYMILRPLEVQLWKEREIRPKTEYKGPRTKFDDINEGVLKEVLGKKELVKALASDLGLGGVYAEEVCLVSGVDKNKKEVSANEIKKIADAVKKLKSKKKNARIVYKNKEVVDVVPVELLKYADFEQKELENYNLAFDSVLTNRNIEKKEVKTKQDKQTEKIETIINSQEKRLIALEKETEENKEKAEMIYQQYALVNEIMTEIKKAREKYSWDEIRKRLKGHRVVKEINEKTGDIVIEI
jgi:predicted ribosome quality control (RQC) complex YloA/Tae2 family protein